MTLPLSTSQRSALTSDQVTIGVRPESLSIADEGLAATIVAVEELGSDSFVYCTPSGQPDVSLVARTHGLNASVPGSTVRLMPDFTAMHVFDTASGDRLEV
jgi:multiple sugar transport system ATP-binding protein